MMTHINGVFMMQPISDAIAAARTNAVKRAADDPPLSNKPANISRATCRVDRRR
jgi:hypothetical protein